MKLSIVIPCYNEAKNIPHIIEQVTEAVKNEDANTIDIVLVNNGSTDESESILNEAFQNKESSMFQVVHVKQNKGYGYGILAGLKVATGDVLSWTHADLQTDPYDVIKAYKLYQSQNNPNIFIKGKRRHRAFLETFFTWGMQVLSSLVLKTYLDDINAQPKLFSRQFYNRHVIENAPWDFSLDLFVLYQAKQYCDSILEIPVDFKKRLYGEAKGGGSWKTRIALIKRTFAYIFQLKQQLNETKGNQK